MRLKRALLVLLLVGATCAAGAPVVAQTSSGSPSPRPTGTTGNSGQGGATVPGGGGQGPSGGAEPINPVPSPTGT
jgi:hypothetical protein